MANTSKTLKYKTAVFYSDTSTRTLQEMVTAALSKKKLAIERRQDVDASSGVVRLINYHGPYKGMKVGELLDYTRGHSQPYTKIEKEKESLPLQAMSPPDNDSDFVHSIFYFGILNNHVIVSQSMSLKLRQFESYLNWLLHDSGQFKGEQFVSLSDQPTESDAAKILNAKGVEFSAPVKFDHSKSGKGDTAPTRITPPGEEIESLRYYPKGPMWKALKAIWPDTLGFPEGIDPDELAMNRELIVKLELKWMRPKKGQSTALIDTIAHQLRHVDDELDYTIKTRDGGEITKDNLKLSCKASIGINSSSKLPKREDMWPQMHTWLSSLIENKRVTS